VEKKRVKLNDALQWCCPDCRNWNEEGDYKCYGCFREVVVLDRDGNPVIKDEEES
jgi:hypothetical protein